MKQTFLILAILSLFIVGCSTTPVEENPSLEQDIVEAPDENTDVLKEEEEEAITEIEKPKIEETPSDEESKEVSEEVKTEEPTINQIHEIKINAQGFDPATITIKKGDSIKWVNERTGRLDQALVVGSSPCTNVKSLMLESGETFTWTFDDTVKCKFTDAITITQMMQVNVEE